MQQNGGERFSAVVAPLPPSALAGEANAACARTSQWARGIEGHRTADLGTGTYLNPIVAGDHHDPTILTDGSDGLATEGQVEPAYAPWRYPDDWIVENVAPEGPKLTWHNGWLSLVTAVCGTAGPVTGSLVIAARSRSVHGPWELCPRNRLVRTQPEQEPWWSRGHASLVQGPRGAW